IKASSLQLFSQVCAPRVLGYPRPVVAQCGTDAILRCQIGGDPRPDVIWERKNVQIFSEGRYRLSEEGKVYLITISDVTQQDAGQYICKAKNSVGETYAAATLKVEGEERAQEEQGPRFLIKPLSLRVDKGEDAAFSCKIWGDPLPEVMWEKDGKKLNDIFESSHFSVSSQDGGWFQLKIYRTRMPDKGVYTCKAVSCNGEALAGAVLLVEPVPEREDSKVSSSSPCNTQLSPKHRGGRPSLSRVKEETAINQSAVKKFAVAEGKHAKFRCFVTGKPKPEIIWKRNGVPLEPGRRHLIFEDREGYYTLKVLYCKEQDTGLYVCVASNALGNTLSAVHLSVKGPAVRFRRPLKDVEVRERDVAVLECEVPDESVPAAWYLEDQRLMPSSKYGIEQKGTRRRLTIQDIGTDDDGVYLCEMPDGGKSIAELSVKGTIVRKLPRKLEVLEGENAAFCVEVEDNDMEVHWFKDGLKLHETHQTILKNFGKTHILVFVNVAHQDSGVVTFVAGRSKTSSRLKVKASRHSPPICPVSVKMDVDRPNGALLTWVPAPNSQMSTRSIFVVERQEVGSQEWQKCFTSESATSAEVAGDSVPCEGNYRFRVCCINKYGRSGHVDVTFAFSILVPGPKICSHLKSSEVEEGEDAHFSIELSAVMVGTWFLNSSQLQHSERYKIQHSQTRHSLVIHGTRITDDRAEITFIANGVRDSATLKVKLLSNMLAFSFTAAVVKFNPLSELESNKKVENGDAIVLYCEVSHSFAKVSWFKDGEELQITDNISIQSDGNMRRIVIQSADVDHSGVYVCKTNEDGIRFDVEVSGKIHSNFNLLSTTNICSRYKDGSEIQSSDNITLQVEGTVRRLIIRSAEASDAGSYTCQAGNNSMEFLVNIRVMIVEPKDDVVMEGYISEEIHLQCELSRSSGKVQWFKDGQKVEMSNSIQLLSEGPYRRLTIPCGSADDSGEYVCKTNGDSVFFQLSVKEPPVLILFPAESEQELNYLTSERLELSCEISKSDAPVMWYKNGLEVEESPNLILAVDGAQRILLIPLTTVEDTGEYICDTEDDSMAFLVTITGKNGRVFPDKLESLAGKEIVMEIQVSRPNAEVTWKFNDEKIEENNNVTVEEDGLIRRLTIHAPTPNDSGYYVCDAGNDKIDFQVKVSEPPVKILRKLEIKTDLKFKLGDDIVLECELSRTNAVAKWYKDCCRVGGEERFCEEEEGAFRSLVILNAELTDTGEYFLDVGNDSICFQVKVEVPRVVEFLTELHNTTVLEGEDATFKCVVSPEDVQLFWHMDNEAIKLGERFQATHNGLCHTLVIKKCQMLDCSRISAEAEGKVSKASLKVQEAQVMFTKKAETVMAEEFGDATLETEISLETGEVQWMRQGVVIQTGPRHTLAQNGCKRSLTIFNLTLSDRGTYRCETLHDRTQVKLNVEPRKISVRKGLINQETFERETASFEVELSHADVEGTWQKDGIRVKPNNRWRVSTNGLVHSLTLSNLTLEDTGTVVFSAEGVRSSARLTIKELEPVRVEEDFPATLECEFSRQNIEVSWSKDGKELKPGKNYRIYSMGRKRFCQIIQCSLTDSGTYTCDTGEISTSCSLAVYGMRHNTQSHKLEIVHELEDLYIKEDQNAVFMCEVSLKNVTGDWYKDGYRIRPTSTIKIRTEVLNLLFAAKDIESTANLEVEELPVSIVRPLRDRTALENHRVILECTMSTPRCDVAWYKDGEELAPSERLHMLVDGCCHKLVIQQVAAEDEGLYSIEVGEHICQAKLMVEGKMSFMGIIDVFSSYSVT
uniref:Obscurin like cytoskeletal adaptor 1a n=1 Tax=Cynoglossus semilaevis TaxID=244447 RepID=A0A3P8VHJ7_CYNSE